MNSTLPMGFVRRGDGTFMETCHDVIHYLIETYPETVINRKVLLLLCTVKAGGARQNNNTGINI